MEPIEAQHQLRADMWAVCAGMTEQVPNGSYDVMGWLTTPTARSSAILYVATWNMNGLDRYKLAYVSMLMQQDNIDVIVMTDTRNSAVTMKGYVRIFKDKKRAETAVHGSIDAKRRPGEPGEHDGGIIVSDGHEWQVGYFKPARQQFYPRFYRTELQEDIPLLQQVEGHVRLDEGPASIGDPEVPTTTWHERLHCS